MESCKAPFEEKIIPGETDFQYWMRTLKVILDTDGSPERILEHPDKTYPAYRWACVINAGYLAFWDSDTLKEEFLITDIGMTSENEKGWNLDDVHNHKKIDFVGQCLNTATDSQWKFYLINMIRQCSLFQENFMMFPISSKRMIVEIGPFYKFRTIYKDYFKMPTLSELTVLNNESLFYPNDVSYVRPQNSYTSFDYDPNDKYIYNVKFLTADETAYCNALFMDRINTLMGFSSLEKIIRSIVKYKKLNTYPFVPRNDFMELYKLINDRFNANLDLDSIARVRQ